MEQLSCPLRCDLDILTCFLASITHSDVSGESRKTQRISFGEGHNNIIYDTENRKCVFCFFSCMIRSEPDRHYGVVRTPDVLAITDNTPLSPRQEKKSIIAIRAPAPAASHQPLLFSTPLKSSLPHPQGPIHDSVCFKRRHSTMSPTSSSIGWHEAAPTRITDGNQKHEMQLL